MAPPVAIAGAAVCSCVTGAPPLSVRPRIPNGQAGYTMQVDEATVRRIAHLARIRISDEEASALRGELNGILSWVEQLGEVDTADVEPMTRVVDMKLKRRQDEVTDGGKADDIVANAPMTEDHFFVVPKVVE
jgi:aspartyl-tRNA(Asn)/glutamyl-tRNA(Gln) amidotransferase subunit C